MVDMYLQEQDTDDDEGPQLKTSRSLLSLLRAEAEAESSNLKFTELRKSQSHDWTKENK